MRIKNLTLNQKLGLIAIILGIIALFTKDPTKASYVRIDPKEFALEARNQSKYISPLELAEKIISGNEYFTLVDLRTPQEFEKGTIPGAININLKDIFENALSRNQKIILFSDEDTKTLNAWLSLKAMEYKNVYVLKGGYQGWKDEVLFPKIPLDTTVAGKEKYEKIKQISLYFGGSPLIVSEGKLIETAVEKSQVQTKATQVPTTNLPKPASAGKPKREGC